MENQFKHTSPGFDYLGIDRSPYPQYGFYKRKSSRFMPHQFRNEIRIKGMIPRILVSKDAYEDMFQLVDIVEKEVGWLGTVEKIENDFLIKEVFLFDQKSHHTTCTITEEGLGTWAMQMMDTRPDDGMDIVNAVRFWGHSHVWMGTSPSGQDDQQMAVFSQSCPEFFIRAIMNKAGRMEFTLYLYEAGIEIHDIEWSIYDPNPDTSRREKWESEIKEKVGEMTYPKYNAGKKARGIKKKVKEFFGSSSVNDFLNPDMDDEQEFPGFNETEEPSNE